MRPETMTVPPERELPPGRAELRRAHLLATIGLRGRRRRVATVLLVAAVVFGLAGTSIAVRGSFVAQQERLHLEAADHPGRVGPVVEIVGTDDWALLAWRSDTGLCLDFAVRGNSAFACGLPVRGAGAEPPTHAVAGFVSGGGLVGGDGKTSIFGLAAEEVARVEIELSDGRVLRPALHSAPSALEAEVQIFLARLELTSPGLMREEGPVRAYAAYDADGRVIERMPG